MWEPPKMAIRSPSVRMVKPSSASACQSTTIPSSSSRRLRPRRISRSLRGALSATMGNSTPVISRMYFCYSPAARPSTSVAAAAMTIWKSRISSGPMTRMAAGSLHPEIVRLAAAAASRKVGVVTGCFRVGSGPTSRNRGVDKVAALAVTSGVICHRTQTPASGDS